MVLLTFCLCSFLNICIRSYPATACKVLTQVVHTDPFKAAVLARTFRTTAASALRQSVDTNGCHVLISALRLCCFAAALQLAVQAYTVYQNRTAVVAMTG